MASTVDTTLADMKKTALELSASAKTQIDTAVKTLHPPEPLNIEPYAYNGWSGMLVWPGNVPAYSGPHYTKPGKTFGAAPPLDPTPGPTYGEMPTTKATKQPFVTPTKPAELDKFVEKIPTLDSIVVPPTPAALLSLKFDPPELHDVTVPAPPGQVAPPDFFAIRPNANLAAPSDFAAQFAANYANQSVSMRSALNGVVDAELTKLNPEYHAQMAALEAKLTTYLAGGTALPVSVEQAIYNRARDKTNAEYLKTRDTIYAEGAARGFTIPAGAQQAALDKARQAAADNNSRAAMDIAVKQAEMEQQNMQFAVTQTANLRGVVLNTLMAFMGHVVTVNGQSLEYAKDILNASIAFYETLVRLVTAQIALYEADAHVYEARLRAVLAVYEIYKSQIEGLKAQVDIDTARVQAFTARMNGYGAMANAYQSLLQGVAAKAQIEKLKVDIYEAKVRTFSALVNAKQGEWQAFTAQVQGEVAKQSGYEAEVRAYGQEVQAYATKIQGYTAQINAIATKNEGSYKVYQAAVGAYTAEIQGESASTAAELNNFEATLKAWGAGQQAQESANRINLESMLESQKLALGLYSASAKVAVEKSDLYNTFNQATTNTLLGTAQVYKGLATSALAGVNMLAADIQNKAT